MEEQLTQAIEVFSKHFSPARSVPEADETLSTTELLDKFEELLGEGNVDVSTLTKGLNEHGYIYDYVDDGFKWLLKTA